MVMDWTGQGSCRAHLHSGILPNHRPVTVASIRLQTILSTCALTKLEGGLQLLHKAD